VGWWPLGAPDGGCEISWGWFRLVLRRLDDRDETSDDATHVDACGDGLSDGGAIPPGSTILLIVSRRLLLAGCLALSLGTARDATLATPRSQSLVLWAWERPEDLRFLRSYVGPSFSSGLTVAFLDRTLVIRNAAVDSLPRRQSLRVPPATPLIAVVRIEGRVAVDDRVQSRLSSEILESARVPGVSMVQIDFDALRSQRASYSQLLREVRSQLPRGVRLSVTALASWCTDDPWIDSASVDEIVPMLFRMGPDARRITTRLSEHNRWPVAACNGAVGVSLDERWKDLPPAARVYVFNPRAWREEDWFTTQRLLDN
jgi:Protein of unknown function (DUF3142)